MQYFKDTFTAVGGIVDRFRRNSRGEQAVEDIQETNTGNSVIDLERSPASRTRRDQEPEDDRINVGGKRVRESESAGPEQKRARHNMGGSKGSLLPNYNTPAGSTPISFAEPKRDMPGPPKATAVRNKVGGGGHKIVNTLNESRHASTSDARFMGGINSNQVTRTLPRFGLKTTESRGLNVPNAREVYGDGFIDDPKPIAKRQKMTNGASKRPPTQGHIDLTKDDSQTDLNTSLLGSSTSGHTQVKAEPTGLSTIKGTSISSKVDKLTRVEPEKRKRKTRNSQSSGQSSAPGTPDDSQLSQPSIQKTFRHPKVEVIMDDIVDDSVKGVHRMSPPPLPNTPYARSKEAATNGSRARRPPKPDPGSSEDVTESTALMNSRSRPVNTSPAKHERDNLEQRATKSKRSVSAQTTNRSSHVQQTSESDNERLNNKFVRDDGSTEKSQAPRPLRRTAMQATSNGLQGRASLGSEDELAGATTVPRSSSRSVSPQKSRPQTTERPKKTRGSALHEELPASPLKPTAFYKQSRAAPKMSSRKLQAAWEQRSVEADEERIAVKAIYCRACCLGDGDIQLVRDSKLRGYLVERNGVIQKVPNRDELVNISGQEVKSWTEAEGNDYLDVLIKTASSAISSGNILIAFEDYENLSTCHETLLWASRETMQSKTETKARMNQIFEKMISPIREEFMKAARSKPAAPDLEMTHLRSKEKRRTIEQDDDSEQIKYEGQSSRSSRRSQMQGDSPDSGKSSRVTSKHFQQPAERRTSRQLKPVKAKSPTPPPPPPRWSQIHKLQPWSQSVIYPPEGAVRRVTVDSQDIERLDEGEFLNDNLISFALRRIEENMPSQHKDKVLYFNSFFYSALTTKNGRKVFNYDAVKRWTKNKDLLSIPYVVVPINIDLHWFVAIICNLPNLSRKFDGSDSESDDDNEMLLNGAEDEELDLLTGITSVIRRAEADLAATSTRKSLGNLSLSDDGKGDLDNAAEHDLVKDSVDPSSSRPSTATGKKSKKKVPPRQRTFDPDAPTIITLDSFGSAHTAEVRNLKEYVVAEAQAKRNISLSRDDLQGVTAKDVPQQQNFCDCGLFLVGYIEQFAKNPRDFVSKLLRKKKIDLDKDFANFDPFKKREEIRDELLKLHDEQDAERKARKTAKKSATCTNGKISKTPQPATTTAAEAQATIDTNAENAESTTPSVPVQFAAESRPELDESNEGAAEASIATFDYRKAEDDELETEIPRALEDPASRSRGSEDLQSASLPVAAPAKEDDTISWEGIVSDNEAEPPIDKANGGVTNSIYDHSIEHYMSPEQARKQHGQGQDLLNRERHTTSQPNVVHVDDESVLVIQDSQEQLKSSMATEVS